MSSSLFSGLCFGDISPSQESSSSTLAATLPDIPNENVTPGCGDRVIECDVTPPAVHHNTSHFPSSTNCFDSLDEFSSSGHDLDGDISSMAAEDDLEHLPPDSASNTQNAYISTIVSIQDDSLTEDRHGAYSHSYDAPFDAEPRVVLSAGDIPDLNILDPDMNNGQIQPDTHPDNSSASVQDESLQSNYIELHRSSDEELVGETTRNVPQNSCYNFHCTDKPGLAIAHENSDSLGSSLILPERTDCDVDLIHFSQPEVLYSSPPRSSPNKIFSSSPPLSSQSSIITEPYPDEPELSKRPIGYDHDDQPQLISFSSSEQNTEDNYDVLPPSSSPLRLVSSPFRSSSPLKSFGMNTKPDQLFHVHTGSETKNIPAFQDIPTSHAIPEVPQESGTAPKVPTQETHSIDDIPLAPQLPEVSSQAKSHALLVLGPKRSTVMSHLRQHKKLSIPFRSPLIKKENDQPVNSLPAVTKSPVSAAKTIMHSEVKPVELKHTALNDPKKKHRTVRAAAQFKSPLSAAASSNVMLSVRMTPAIQSLERRVQILRRAVKVKKEGEEELLESLAKRWTEAAREVAWELWDLVKDNGANEHGSWGDTLDGMKKKRGFEDSWEWEDKGDKKRLKTENFWGWNEPQRKEGEEDEDEMQGVESHGENDNARNEEDDKPENTLGLMLRQFGIAPETLGWNEEDGMFAESSLR